MSIPLPFFLSNSLLFLTLMGISMKDFKDGIIPNILLVALAGLGFLRFGGAHWLTSLLLGIVAYGLYKLYPFLKGQDGIGLGDVKMMAASGLWLEPLQIPLFLILSGGIGIGIAIVWRVLKKNPQFP